MERKGVFKRHKKLFCIIFGVFAAIAVLVMINFIPTWNLKTSGMHKLDGKWLNVYYETEKSAAEDVFELADSETEWIAKKLGFAEKQNVNVYIYDNQNTMQKKKYGFIAPMLGLDWYIGDNIGTDVILTSPANPGPVHDYDNNKNAVLHEIVHAYISTMNPYIRLWLTEGTALYLTNGEPFSKEYIDDMNIPSYADTKTKNPITFSNCGGYIFAHTYIEYIDVTYGWKSVLKLLETEDYENIFNKSEEDIYNEWVNYIKNYHQ